MNPWDLTVNFKDVILDFLLMSTFILMGTVLRRYVKFLQTYLIPNNFIAGFIALGVGAQGLGWIQMSADRMILYVYHLLALTFIALGLRKSKSHWGRGPFSKAMSALSSYALQAVIGLVVVLILYYTVMPDIFPGMGLVLPLGFGMGPGLAATLAGSWEKYGFTGGAQVGLTLATIGYAYAFFVGVALIHWGIRNGRTSLIRDIDHLTHEIRTGVRRRGERASAGNLTLYTEAVEPLAFHMAAVGFIYLLTYLAVKFITDTLTAKGLVEFVPTVWSFHFVVGLILAIAGRKILDMTDKSYLIDNGLMTRSMGLFLDYLVVGAIAGISISVISMYWLPILIMSLLAGPATLFLLTYLCNRAFSDFHFERLVELYGEMTGTINSALVLLRITDPEFETPVAEDSVVGSGIALLFGFPFLYGLSIPFVHFQNSITGYWVTLMLILVYWAILLLIWYATGYFRFTRNDGRGKTQKKPMEKTGKNA